MKNHITATYYIETTEDLRKIAETMAKMQSTGTWKELSAETRQIIKKYGAVVKSVKKTGEKSKYELPTKQAKGKKVNCGTVKIDYPCDNFGSRISMILTTTAGEIFDMQELTAVKLTDIDFREDFLKSFHGPAFGLEGCRDIVKAYGRPLFGAIIKPCVGLTPNEIAKMAYDVSRAGADFIKDDELLADAPYNPLKDRIIAVSKALGKSYEETGKITMYAFNVTDDADRSLDFHDLVKKHGGRALMFNVLSGGFSVLASLAKRTEMPIHCHRDFAVASFRSRFLGISSNLFTKLIRLSGGDQIQCGGGAGSYLYETDEEVIESVDECLDKMGKIKKSLPVISGGQWAGTLTANLKKLKHTDFMFLCGGGVFGHPDGGYAGMRSLYAAYEAFTGKIPLKQTKDKYLKAAIKYFGKPL